MVIIRSQPYNNLLLFNPFPLPHHNLFQKQHLCNLIFTHLLFILFSNRSRNGYALYEFLFPYFLARPPPRNEYSQSKDDLAYSFYSIALGTDAPSSKPAYLSKAYVLS